MANSATTGSVLPIELFESSLGLFGGGILPIAINYDTSDADLTVYDLTDITKTIILVGLPFAPNAAGILRIKSGSNTLIRKDLAANQDSQMGKIGEIYAVCNVGEDLIIRYTGTSPTISTTAYLVVADKIRRN